MIYLLNSYIDGSTVIKPIWWTRNCVPNNHIYEMVNITQEIVQANKYRYICIYIYIYIYIMLINIINVILI